MMRRVLLAMDDSPAALAAARLAVELAAGWGATVRVVTVVADHGIDTQLRAALSPANTATVRERRSKAADAILVHVVKLAAGAAVPVEPVQLAGEPGAQILEQARSWRADLIVLGRSGATGPGQPYVGGETRHVLEFAVTPVMVVPHPEQTGY
ncbi:MAG TPA: universal stress protein [Pilimelia sp.]|nr:universal stress protein [Pilimelia sp.]